MNIWMTLILIVHVLVALAIIGLVLLQHGKGADVGAAFGSGASGSLFGATGSANFLSRATAILAAVFFLTSLGLTYLATHNTRSGGGVMDAVKEAPAPATPPASPQGAVPGAAQSAPQGAQVAPGAPADAAKSGGTAVPAPPPPAKNPDSKANEVPK
ncbi:MAG TPA: preprotein translocase subunit SecG [Burkholderiales bacterium]|nr:preprotein translocase subunit SecG [Burkholderiales bacterium]